MTRRRSRSEILSSLHRPNHLIGHSRSTEVRQKLLQSHLEHLSMFQSLNRPASLRSKHLQNKSQQLRILSERQANQRL